MVKKVKVKEVKKLEPQEQYVYDIGIGGDTPYFFANNVLVHNSFGARIEPLVERIFKGEIPKEWDNAKIDKVCKVLDEKLIPLVNANCKKIVKEKFLSDLSTIEFKREKFCAAAAFLKKKKYAVYVLNNEGINEKDFIHKGTVIKQSPTPAKLKERMKYIVESSLIEKWSPTKFTKYCEEFYEEFKTWDLNDFCKSIGYGTEKVFRKRLDRTGVTSVGAISANIWNGLLEELNLTDKYEMVRVGDRLRQVYVKPNNKWKFDYIGYVGEFPKEFYDYFEVDYYENFQRFFLKPLETFLLIFGWRNPNLKKMSAFDIDDL